MSVPTSGPTNDVCY